MIIERKGYKQIKIAMVIINVMVNINVIIRQKCCWLNINGIVKLDEMVKYDVANLS